MDKERFEKELEFIQLLSNPQYLQFLYNENYFSDLDFLDYLNYLKYWENEPYRNFLIYPQCLEILSLCLDPKFVESLSKEQTYILLSDQQYFLWNNDG